MRNLLRLSVSAGEGGSWEVGGKRGEWAWGDLVRLGEETGNSGKTGLEVGGRVGGPVGGNLNTEFWNWGVKGEAAGRKGEAGSRMGM